MIDPELVKSVDQCYTIFCEIQTIFCNIEQLLEKEINDAGKLVPLRPLRKSKIKISKISMQLCPEDSIQLCPEEINVIVEEN